MTREKAKALGFDRVWMLGLRGTRPLLLISDYSMAPHRSLACTTPDQRHAEVFARAVDADEMRRRLEHVTGYRLELVLGDVDPDGTVPASVLLTNEQVDEAAMHAAREQVRIEIEAAFMLDGPDEDIDLEAMRDLQGYVHIGEVE